VPREHAEGCMQSWWKVVEVMGWEDKVESRRTEKNGTRADGLLTPPEEAEIMARL